MVQYLNRFTYISLVLYIKNELGLKSFWDEIQALDIVQIQSTLVVSKSKGSSETLLDILTSTYQICRIVENTNQATKFHK